MPSKMFITYKQVLFLINLLKVSAFEKKPAYGPKIRAVFYGVLVVVVL